MKRQLMTVAIGITVEGHWCVDLDPSYGNGFIVQWSSKVCIQNQSLLGTTVRVRRQLNLTGGTVR